MNDPREMIQLPMGDLWMPPQRDEAGEIIPRAPTVSTANLPSPSKMTPDVAAILMAELGKQGK